MHIRNRLFNNTPRATNYLSNVSLGLAHKTLLAAAIAAATLSACGKSEVPVSTADRVKIVEERQKTDPNFYVEKQLSETKANTPSTVAPALPATVQAEPSKASAKM